MGRLDAHFLGNDVEYDANNIYHLRVARIDARLAELRVRQQCHVPRRTRVALSSKETHMTPLHEWLAAAGTLAAVATYEFRLSTRSSSKRAPSSRDAHAQIRTDWFAAVNNQPGSEVLAVQTIRNGLMAASLLASTAALAMMGTASLAAPSIHAQLNQGGVAPQTFIELCLLTLLFSALTAAVISARYFHHTSFVVGMPIGSAQRTRWSPLGERYLNKAGALYGWALRQLILCAPAIAFLVHPLAAPALAAVSIAGLLAFDRLDKAYG